MCGPALEYYLIDPIFTNDENEFVTELRIPVKAFDSLVTRGFIINLR